jgi:predicted AAA+ superfamily ATPase
MRPLALSERGIEPPTVSLEKLFRGTRPKVQGQTRVTLRDYTREIIASGFPGIRPLRGRSLRAQLRGYVEHLVDRDIQEQGYRIRKPNALRRWMAAYAAVTATTTSYEKIRNAATAGETDKPTQRTVADYREILERLWIVDAVPGWSSTASHLARLTQSPKHHLADPALAAELLGLDEGALLAGDSGPATPRDGTYLGQLFESLVTLSVRVYAQAAEARVYHARTEGGRHEIDLILERRDRRVIALETKLGGEVRDDDVRHLHWLQEELGKDLLDSVVITTGTEAYRRKDGIAVVPAALLGP